MAKDTTNMEIKISAPNIREAKFLIRGTAPLVVHKFSAKAKAMIRQKQEAGSLANKGKSKPTKAKAKAQRTSKKFFRERGISQAKDGTESRRAPSARESSAHAVWSDSK